MAVASDSSAARSVGGVPGASLRGHELVCDTREEGYDHAEGYTVGETDTRGLGRFGMKD